VTAFLARRLIGAAAVLLAMSFVVYGLIGLMPGDPVDLMIASDPNLTPADAVRLKSLYGLDRPLVERYLAWLVHALQGDLGYSRIAGRPVLEVLVPRLGNTALLMGLAFLLSMALALPAGIYAAARPRSLADGAVNLAAFAGISMPPYWLAILLIILFAVVLGALPAGGTGGLDGGTAIELALDRARHLALPVLTLGLLGAGGLVRYVRSAMMEALAQDYVRTARAKGVSRRRVVLRHALRNAMIPVVTVLALDFGGLFAGALVTETMFAYLGMGKTIYDAVMGNDYNLALAALLLATALVVAANLAADLAYAWLDPRVRVR
jgi:peptide/nickel transport system permease protein